MIKLFKIGFSVLAVLFVGFWVHTAYTDWSDRDPYSPPPPPVDPSTPEKACYNALTDCVQDCDRMFPAPYVYQPNEDFQGCVKLCNKTANLCIAEIKR